MATIQSIKPQPERSSLSNEQSDVALYAAWEAEACAAEALKILEDVGVEYLAARSLVLRLRDLANITMDALQGEPLPDAKMRLTGVSAAAEA